VDVTRHLPAHQPSARRVPLLLLRCGWAGATGVLLPLHIAEFYGLQLQYLSPHSLILVVIFIHLCKMFISVRPSVTLFQMFHVLRWSKNASSLIGAYYFQLWATSLIAYITPITHGKWDRWRQDRVIIRADIHDRLALPTESPTVKHSDWEETPKLHVAYRPMIERIKHLMSHGLSAMMVLHDFLLRRITPLQDRARPAWMFTEEGNTMQLGALLRRLSPDPSSVDFVSPSAVCGPMCSDQAARTRLLRELPTLDDINIVARQRGDESRDVQIPGADKAGGQGSASTGPSSSKGKGNAAP
jgi:hypothetical protein